MRKPRPWEGCMRSKWLPTTDQPSVRLPNSNVKSLHEKIFTIHYSPLQSRLTDMVKLILILRDVILRSRQTGYWLIQLCSIFSVHANFPFAEDKLFFSIAVFWRLSNADHTTPIWQYATPPSPIWTMPLRRLISAMAVFPRGQARKWTEVGMAAVHVNPTIWKPLTSTMS